MRKYNSGQFCENALTLTGVSVTLKGVGSIVV